MTEFDAQAGRVVADAGLTSEQVAADEVDLADGLQGLAQMVAVGQSLEETLTEIATFAAQAIPGVDGAGPFRNE